MENKYFLTEDQLESLTHHKRMFDNFSDVINDLCAEQKDDINIGFELGKIYSYLKDNYIDMDSLITEIKEQELLEPENKDKLLCS